MFEKLQSTQEKKIHDAPRQYLHCRKCAYKGSAIIYLVGSKLMADDFFTRRDGIWNLERRHLTE